MNTQPTHKQDANGLNPAFETLYRAHLQQLGTRLERALEATGFDAVAVFAGHAPQPIRDDQAYAFRVEPFFAQWCPYACVPGAVIVLVPGRKPRLVLPRPNGFWHMPPPEPAGEWVTEFDILTVDSDDQVLIELERSACGAAMIGDELPTVAGLGPANPDDLLVRLSAQRATKTPFEVECIRGANAIAAKGHLAVEAAFAEGASEFDLHIEYLRATGHRDEELPYPSIVAINEHAAVLHYQQLDRVPARPARSLLLDAGARFHGYAADVTRTVSRTESKFTDLIAALDAAQQTLCAQARAGVDFAALDDEAHRSIAQLLESAEIVLCSAEQAHENGITRAFLPHGLGHLLGLQVHDAGGHLLNESGETKQAPRNSPYLRLTRPLEPGFVVTIEPGIYFIGPLLDGLGRAERRCVNWKLIEELRPCGGIRIEDDVLVKAEHNANLTREAFAALQTEPATIRR